jgi:hypothetical protein
MKMYRRWKKSTGQPTPREGFRSESAPPSSAILEGTILPPPAPPSALYPRGVLGLHLYLFHAFSLPLFPPPRYDLSSSRLWYYRGFGYIPKLARSLSVLQRALPRQGSHGHRRYLPSGINQLNARLLEASPSPEPILPAFLRLPVLFSPPRRVRGEAAIRPICRLLIQLVLPPPLRAHHCAPRRSRVRARAHRRALLAGHGDSAQARNTVYYRRIGTGVSAMIGYHPPRSRRG